MAKTQKTSNASPAPVYAVFGADAYLRGQAVERIKALVLGADRDRMALAEFEGDNARLADVLDECRTASLLAPLRLVIVNDSDGFVTAHRAALESYIEEPCPTGVLMLVCRSWQKSWRIYKLVEKVGVNIPCETPKAAALPGWLAGQAQEAHGVRLEPQAARRLADLVGPQLGLLDMELAKLATYVLPRTGIRLEDVDALVGASREEKVFILTDAISAGDAGGALALWDQVMAMDRKAEFRAVGGLRYAFARLAEAKRLVGQGSSLFDAARAAGIWTDTHQLKRQLDRFSLRQWQQILVKLLSIDVATKTGLGTVRSAVEKLIVELCATGPARVAAR
ncbi:MAG TPA: DNA polymerase III subunit delta [Phycisphaerae bacterium]|nr:DNA polymerase III subunit delta [Phycisphaerae bacterium]